MKICAVIAEYNPFHNGHLKQIEYIKENLPDTAIVAIMSGNVVQRGELAVLDKYTRAHSAVLCGVDAVLELPYPWCGGSAGYFARGAMDIAKGIGADHLCFGSESGDIKELKAVAERINGREYIGYLDSLIKQEPQASYIALSRRAYKELYNSEIPDGANNTLAIEYLKNIGDVTPITYKRSFPSSATAARGFYRAGYTDELRDTVPHITYQIYRSLMPTQAEDMGKAALWQLRNMNAEDMCRCADVDMGIASRIIDAANESATLTELYDRCATKKYTNSRVRRAIMNILLGTTKEHLDAVPAFTTLLAANKDGCAVIRRIKKQGSIRIVTKPADHDGVKEQFEFSGKADKLYYTAKGISTDKIFKNKPVIL